MSDLQYGGYIMVTTPPSVLTLRAISFTPEVSAGAKSDRASPRSLPRLQKIP